MKCTVCKLSDDVRPYGNDGADICFKCAMATPESKAEAERQLDKRLTKLKGQGPIVFSNEKPPEPLTAENIQHAVAIMDEVKS